MYNQKKYREEHKKEAKIYRATHKEYYKEYHKIYYQNHKKKLDNYRNIKNKEQAEVIRKMIANVCEKCGSKDYEKNKFSLCIHHKDRNHLNNSLENLMILCPSCHMKEHSKDKIRNENGQIIGVKKWK